MLGFTGQLAPPRREPRRAIALGLPAWFPFLLSLLPSLFLSLLLPLPACLPALFFSFYLARTRTQQTKRTQAASEAGLELAIFLPALHKCWVTGWASTRLQSKAFRVEDKEDPVRHYETIYLSHKVYDQQEEWYGVLKMAQGIQVPLMRV